MKKYPILPQTTLLGSDERAGIFPQLTHYFPQITQIEAQITQIVTGLRSCEGCEG